MKRLIQFTLCNVALLASIGFVGCTDDIVLNSPTAGGAGGDGVIFNFVVDDLNVATEDKGSSVGTRTTTADEPSSEIKNMWVMQFDDADNLLISTYYDEFTSTSCIDLDDDVSDFVFIANTFDENLIGDEGTVVATKSDLDDITTNETTITGDDGAKYFVLSGTIEDYTPKRGGIVTLKRNVAKVNIKVTDQLDDDTFEINSIKIYNIPTSSRYYIAPDAHPLAIDSEEEATTYTLSLAELAAATGDSGVTIYLPANEQGVIESNNDSKDKAGYAPEFATYVVVEFYKSDDIYSHLYKFYLGADMVTDYNISANNAYNYTFNINAEGNVDFDSRVSLDLIYIPMVKAADLASWLDSCSDIAKNGLHTEFFDFEYSLYEVKGTNWMSTSAVIASASPIVDGHPTNPVTSHDIKTTTDVSNDVLPKLQEKCGTGFELPTHEELMYMWIFRGDVKFKTDNYWASGLKDDKAACRWILAFDRGYTDDNYTTTENYARAVRGIDLP